LIIVLRVALPCRMDYRLVVDRAAKQLMFCLATLMVNKTQRVAAHRTVIRRITSGISNGRRVFNHEMD